MINEGLLQEEREYEVKWYQRATFGVCEGYKKPDADIKGMKRDCIYINIYRHCRPEILT